METLSIVLSIVSIVIAVGATALAIVFFRWADNDARKTAENLAETTSAIERLNQVVEILRGESFALLKSSHEGLLELATQGMRLESSTGGRSATPDTRSRVYLREGAASKAAATSEGLTDHQKGLVAEALGRRMMERRGAEFVTVLAKLQKRILAEFDKNPKGTVFYPGEILRRLGDEELDIGDVVYAMHTLAATGQVRDA